MDFYLSSLFGLQGKTALITGGTRGIGRTLSIALARAGADIVLLTRDIDAGLSLLEEIGKIGRAAHMYKSDLTEGEEALKFIPLITEHGDDIDIFVHFANPEDRGPDPGAKWDEIMNLNVARGFEIFSGELAEYWFNTTLRDYNEDSSASRRKKMIFVASTTSFTGSGELPPYTASDGGIELLTKTLNQEWMSRGINVNAIAPGYIESELPRTIKDGGEKELETLQTIPAGRWGNSADLAGTLIHLCARSGDYVGGEVLAVDGGHLGRFD